MKVWLDRDTCDSNLAACEGCFGQFLRTGVPDRGCMLAWRDDGSEDVTLYMMSEGKTHTVVEYLRDVRRHIVGFDPFDVEALYRRLTLLDFGQPGDFLFHLDHGVLNGEMGANHRLVGFLQS